MSIYIVGHGKMGREVENCAQYKNISIEGIARSSSDLSEMNFKQGSVAIEFTKPEVCVENIRILAEKGVNIVCGTTGWLDRIDEVKDIVQKNNIGFLYGSNFSIGVNIFWMITEYASKIMNKFDDYDVMIHEAHHKHKKDWPSGTSISTAEIILNNIDRKTNWNSNKLDRPLNDDEIHLGCTRGGHIFGKHDVIFDSEVDEITISHNAKNRIGFANGAIECAKWISNKTGFFTVNDFINDII